MSKHYIRLDVQNRIIKGFSTDFEQPLETDICINENGGRHFEIDGIINPSLVYNKGVFIYKYENGQVVKRTNEEIVADESSIVESKTETEILKETVDMLVVSMLGGL